MSESSNNDNKLNLFNNELDNLNILGSPEEDERYMQNLCDITSSNPMNAEQSYEANNYKNYLTTHFVKPSHQIQFLLYGNGIVNKYEYFMNGTLNIFAQYYNSQYSALYNSIKELLTNNIDTFKNNPAFDNILDELLYYKLFTVDTTKTIDQSLILISDFTKSLPSNIIFVHSNIVLPDKLSDDELLSRWFRMIIPS